ncbi:hypothetical protein [Agromyces neolithicus]|uniref:hypothetical protein n=1 Tax=Agromyces neolithicus TaxID=269420 RepID=UPI0031E24282
MPTTWRTKIGGAPTGRTRIGEVTMHGTRTTAALAFAAALVLSGCALSGCAADGTAPTSVADACATIQDALRDLSNGAQNALASADDPAEIQATLEGYSQRAGTLAEKADNPDVADTLETLDMKLSDAAVAVGTLPTDAEGELDVDAIAEQQTEIQEAVAKISAACANQQPEG